MRYGGRTQQEALTKVLPQRPQVNDQSNIKTKPPGNEAPNHTSADGVDGRRFNTFDYTADQIDPYANRREMLIDGNSSIFEKPGTKWN